MCRLSLVVKSRGYSLVVVCRLLTMAASLVAKHWLTGFRKCSSQAPEHRLNSVAQELHCSAASGIPQTRDGVHPVCIGRQILYH